MHLMIDETLMEVFSCEQLPSGQKGFVVKHIPVPRELVSRIVHCQEPFPPLLYWAHQWELDDEPGGTAETGVEMGT